MLSITEYLNRIFEEFKGHCDEGTQNVKELAEFITGGIKNNSPRTGGDERTSIYKDPIKQQMYLLKYAYAYTFEYSAIYNAFIDDFKNKEEISVVSLGCGAMLDYQALAYVLDRKEEKEKEFSWPVVKYRGIDAIRWNDRIKKAQARNKDDFEFSQENFKNFFERPDNEFNTYDVYFFPRSISELTYKINKKLDEASSMGLLLNRLSAMKKDTVYFCISLRKKQDGGVVEEDADKVREIIDRLEDEENGFHVKEIKCIYDGGEKIPDVLKAKLLREQDIPPIEPIKLGRNKKVCETAVADTLGYPAMDEGIGSYLKTLKCADRAPETNSCKECDKCMGWYNPMINTTRICGLLIKFERR